MMLACFIIGFILSYGVITLAVISVSSVFVVASLVVSFLAYLIGNRL